MDFHGNYLALGLMNGKISLYNAITGDHLFDFQAHYDKVNQLPKVFMTLLSYDLLFARFDLFIIIPMKSFSQEVRMALLRGKSELGWGNGESDGMK